MCERHFTDADFQNKNRNLLVRNGVVVPTQNLPTALTETEMEQFANTQFDFTPQGKQKSYNLTKYSTISMKVKQNLVCS